MTSPYAEATHEAAVDDGIANLLGVVADNKYHLGRWLSQWAVGAPGLESAVAAAGIAQGHLGQARALYPLVDELTRRWEHGRSHLTGPLASVLPEVLCWFGPADEQGVRILREAGVLSADGAGMRRAYLDIVAPVLLELEYNVGVSGRPGDWTYEELPWQDWNPLQRRLETTG
jgi:1,2-phenylacetyl-CoA epoxidase catalytic subunit